MFSRLRLTLTHHAAHGLFDGNRLVDHPSDNPRRSMRHMYIEGSEAVLCLDAAGRLRNLVVVEAIYRSQDSGARQAGSESVARGAGVMA